MGRKIPAKKHRGVKDPLVQQARRLQSLKGKINAPPKDPDEQPVPQSLTRLFAFQHKDKNKKKKVPKVSSADNITQSNGDNPVSKLRKLPGESGRDFSLRINSAVRALHHPLEQQDYPDDMEADDMKGERMRAQRERRKRKRGAGAVDADTERAKHRLTLKKQAQKEKAAEEAAWAGRVQAQYERVQFGDVAHAPPALRAPRHARPTTKPARRGLLLSAMLGGAGAAERAGEAQERARLDAVAAYRALKKERRLQDNAKKKPHK
ncbi:coiled-coil domain-containing protein 137 [Bicyclus anynana]|uniref:Coiled-coil domain-containing protein 137 n=1 Tax=Bicyclus anynana TaxID=110368 RepID=A0A6J1MIF1_BICAN|nr:coiled-coil domain-containing protein 137 [Bicyclus anynana]